MSDFTVGANRAVERPFLRAAIADTAMLLHDMLRARATRQLLQGMDDRLLSDIGIGRGDALEEARRPMWDLTQRRT